MTEVVHVVSWRLRAADPAERERDAQTVVAAVEALRGQVPGLLRVDAGANIVPDPDAWDVGAVMVFASRPALDHYQDHPAHRALKAVVGPLRSARSQFDFARPTSEARPMGEDR